jgi:DNA-binding Xre family transcriptional regulator
MKMYFKLQQILDNRGITQQQLAQETRVGLETIKELCDNTATDFDLDELGNIVDYFEIDDMNEILEFKDK